MAAIRLLDFNGVDVSDTVDFTFTGTLPREIIRSDGTMFRFDSMDGSNYIYKQVNS